MKIVVVSDSHNDKKFVDFLQKNAKEVIVCLGDYCMDDNVLINMGINYVNGNCDKNQNILDGIIEQQDKRIYFTHGHKYNVKFGMDKLYYSAAQNNCQFCLFGHTHQRCFLQEDGIIFINPGAFCERQYAVLEDNRVVYYQGKKVYRVIDF